MFVIVYVALCSLRHKSFVSGLARGITLYAASISSSDNSADAFRALKTGE